MLCACWDVLHSSTAKIPIVEERPYKFDAITTAMADYTAPSGIQRRKPYFEPKSEHFVMGEPFEDKTTFRTTYIEWPVTRSELPKWAKQPVYKRPVGGMLLVSSYMVSVFCHIILISIKILDSLTYNLYTLLRTATMS